MIDIVATLPSHDLVIYAPGAASYYDAAASINGGGAERQTWLLARAMARRGLRVAHVVGPVAEPKVDPDAPVTLIEQPSHLSDTAAHGRHSQLLSVWIALSRADATVQVLRGANGKVGIAGVWSRARGRRLIFAGANDADFTLATFPSERDWRARMFRAGIGLTSAIVVQTGRQEELARQRFPRVRDLHQIASFVEPSAVPAAPAEAFLWVSRLVDYKRPLAFLDLAEAVPEAQFKMITTPEPIEDTGELQREIRRRAETLPNLELLEPRPHADLQALIARAVAVVNTSEFEGMPNTWLEGWAQGVPALTLSFDPDHRIARRGLGISGGGSWEDFVEGARRLWARRADRHGYGPAVREFVGDVHGRQVEDAWYSVISPLAGRG